MITEIYLVTRNLNAWLVGLFLRYLHISWRFSKDYRHGVSFYHRFVYNIVSTVDANYIADGYGWKIKI